MIATTAHPVSFEIVHAQIAKAELKMDHEDLVELTRLLLETLEEPHEMNIVGPPDRVERLRAILCDLRRAVAAEVRP